MWFAQKNFEFWILNFEFWFFCLDPICDPICDPIRDPVCDPIRDLVRDPVRDLVRDPIRDPVQSDPGFVDAADDGVFDDFPKISDHIPKISEDSPKLVRRPHERCRTFSENSRRLTKIAEDFWGRPEDVSITPMNLSKI